MDFFCFRNSDVWWNKRRYLFLKFSYKMWSICNGNKNSCRPIRSLIIRVIDKIGRLYSGNLIICLITSMITDRIGRHKVLLPILIITLTKFVIIKALFLNQNTRKSKIFLLAMKKKAIAWWRVLSNYSGMTGSLILNCFWTSFNIGSLLMNLQNYEDGIS